MNEEQLAWHRRRVARYSSAPQPTGTPRRTLLLGVLAGGALAGAGMTARNNEGPENQEDAHERQRAELDRERAFMLSASFSDAVHDAAREYGTRHEVREEGAERSELDILLDRSERDRIGDRTCSAFFRDTVMEDIDDREIPETIRLELSHLVPGLLAYESRYNNDAVAYEPTRTVLPDEAAAERLANRLHTPIIKERLPDGRVVVEERALARMQALPSTFVEYGFEMKDIQDPLVQARFIGAYFKEAYRVFRQTDAFNAVRLRYFPNDHEGFRRLFVVPCMLNAYHSGIGTMQDLVVWFAERATRRELVGHGYEPYYLMNRLAFERRSELPGDARNFGPEAAKYVPHGFALARLIAEADTRRETLLPR